MTDILSFFHYDFFINAFLASLIISIPAGVIGTLVVANRLVFSAEGIAHSAFGGIGIALFLGISPYLGAGFFSILMAMFVAYSTFHSRERSDSIIGIVMAVSMSLGIIFMNLTPGYKSEPMTYLFGNILSVSRQDIIFISIFSVLLLMFVCLFYRKLLMVSYDPVFARIRKVNVGFWYVSIFLLISLTVVFVIKLVGIILLIALLSIPAYIAENYVRSLSSMMILSSLISVVMSLSGLFLSVIFDLPTSGSIVLTGGVIFFIHKIKLYFREKVSQ